MPASPDEVLARLNLARAVAIEAGEITLKYFRRSVEVERKSDDSPVTVADRESEQHIRRRVLAEFADDAFLGEEFPEQPGNSGFRWIVDPIDGTKSFIRGVPLYGTMVSVERDARAIIGVVNFPPLGECAYAAKGQGAWLLRDGGEAERLRVNTVDRLSESLFVTTAVDSFDMIGRRDAFDRLQAASRVTRTWGDCYGYVLVASGRAEVMVDPVMNVWDAAALQPIMEEAGGTFTDWKGNATIHAGEGIATNGHVLGEVLAITRGLGSADD